MKLNFYVFALDIVLHVVLFSGTPLGLLDFLVKTNPRSGHQDLSPVLYCSCD